MKNKFSLRKKFQYWFDNRMNKGSLGFIRVLIIASILLAVLVAGIIILFHFNEEGEVASIFWDSISTVINAWMPSYEEGSIGYLVLMSIVAIAGLLFTSVFIGIITSAIEEKIERLKKGNSFVLEKGHIVVLGFYPGEYTLINQLILAAAGKPACVVIAEDMDREEMEEDIRENLEIPKNFRIVCRTADITDPVALEKCSVETCKTVIISPTEDMRTIKAVLAVSTLLEEKGVPEISVNAIISKEEYRFPPSIAEANHITTLQTNSILAKMIAHSCTQTGLSQTFKEIFDFEGSEFYLVAFPGMEGLSFEEIMNQTNHATPTGIYHDGKVMMNPNPKIKIGANDKILVFSEEMDSAILEENKVEKKTKKINKLLEKEEATNTIIIGHNETLPIILQELPENVQKVYLAGRQTTKQEKQELEEIVTKRNMKLEYYEKNIHSEKGLFELAKLAEHIVVLSDHDQDAEESDMEGISLLLNLRDIRKRFQLDFNITVEMQKEHNQKLVGRGDHTDFLVSSSMSSLILAQLAESPEIIDVFREILSNKGNEIYLKNAGLISLLGEYTTRELRSILLHQGYIFLGYIDSNKKNHFDLSLDENISLSKEDSLIVLGEK